MFPLLDIWARVIKEQFFHDFLIQACNLLRSKYFHFVKSLIVVENVVTFKTQFFLSFEQEENEFWSTNNVHSFFVQVM